VVPDHSKRVSPARGVAADLVFTLGIALQRQGRDLLTGVTPADSYVPYAAAPASTWLLRRGSSTHSAAGGRTASATPYHRKLPAGAWRAGFRMVEPGSPAVTIFSGDRAGCYARRDSAEHEEYLKRIQSDPTFPSRAGHAGGAELRREVHRIDTGRTCAGRSRRSLPHLPRLRTGAERDSGTVSRAAVTAAWSTSCAPDAGLPPIK